MFRGRIIRNEPAYRPRPKNAHGYYGFSDGTFTAYVAEEALDHMSADARRALPNETLGYLVGRPFWDERGTYLIVSTALTAEQAAQRPTSVTTTVSDEHAAADAILRRYPTGERVGWYHSHPFDSPNYSAVDRENQRLWCPRAYEVGLLVCSGPGPTTIVAFRGPQSRRLLGSCRADAKPPRRLAEHHQPGRDAPVEAIEPADKAAHEDTAAAPPISEPAAAGPMWLLVTLSLLVIAGMWHISRSIEQGADRMGDVIKRSAVDGNANQQWANRIEALEREVATIEQVTTQTHRRDPSDRPEKQAAGELPNAPATDDSTADAEPADAAANMERTSVDQGATEK